MKRFSLPLIVGISLVFILLSVHGIVSASERETELFNQGYEYLFSFKPDKAAETFRLFLKEFPESTARDAAMFWLSKTLISMKLYSEAELTFQAIQKEFPDSPFIVFIPIEMAEIARIRSTGSITEDKERSEPKKALVSNENQNETKPRDTDRKLTQILAEKEMTESLLEAERRASREHVLRIADLESRESLLKKQNAELDEKVRKLADSEKSLNERKDAGDRLSTEMALLPEEKSISGKDSGNSAALQTSGQNPGVESVESLRFRLAQFELLSEEQGKELKKAREERENFINQVQEEKKFAAELRADFARLKEREQGDRAPSTVKESEKLIGEVNAFKGQVNELQTENTILTNRIDELEHQAEQRIRDMKILNAYLTKLMFRKKEAPQQKPDISAVAVEERDRLKIALHEEKKTAELRSELSAIKGQPTKHQQSIEDRPPPPLQAASPTVLIMNREYSLSQIIDYQSTALLLFRRLGIKDIVWRMNNPLDDFITEELLVEASRKANMTIDTKKQKEIIERHKLSPAEAAYLDRVMIIGRYIDFHYRDMPSEQWIEVLSVDYKPGDAASKTVSAAELQKAARGGSSFQEISNNYPDRVRFFRLTPQEFSSRFKDNSPILQKLNFINQEVAVMWSKRGYLLIKPVSGRALFNAFEDLEPEKKKRLQAFLAQRISELRKEAGL